MPHFIKKTPGATVVLEGGSWPLVNGEVTTAMEVNTLARGAVQTMPGFTTTELYLDPHPSIGLDGQIYLVDGYFYELSTSAELSTESKMVLFEGGGPARNNGRVVEGRFFSSREGNISGWKAIGIMSDGQFSGEALIPASDAMCFKDVRFADDPGVIYRLPQRCRVGYVAAFEGRSNTATSMQAFNNPAQTGVAVVEVGPKVPLENFGQVSFIGSPNNIETAYGGGTVPSMLRYGMVGDPNRVGNAAIEHDTLKVIANQWAKFSRKGLCIMGNARNSGVATATYEQIHAMYGRDRVSIAVGWGYYSSDLGISPVITETDPVLQLLEAQEQQIDAVFYGNEDLRFVQTGIVKGQTYGRRTTEGSDPLQSYHRAIASQLSSGFVGPAMPHIRMQGSEWGPHPMPFDLRGNAFQAAMYAVAIARGLGLDDSTNPYFDEPMFNQDRSIVYVRAVPTNGGEIYSPRPADITNWAVTSDNGVTWQTDTFSAFLSGNTVALVKNTGQWPANLKVLHDTYGVDPAGDPALETRLINGTVFETWEKDVNGYGLAVTGTVRSDGLFSTEMYETPVAWNPAADPFPTAGSLLAYLDPANGFIGRTSTKPLKVPGIDAMPDGALFTPSTKMITFPQAREYVFEDWDLRGCHLRINSGNAAAIITVRQSLIDNSGLKSVADNGAVIQVNAGGIGIIEFNDIIASGDFSNGEITKPISAAATATAGQGLVRNNVIWGWAADPIDGPSLIVERNRVTPTSMLHFMPAAWAAGNTYAENDWVMFPNTSGNAEYAYRCKAAHVASESNEPLGIDGNPSVSDNVWWELLNPHADMITLRGTRAGRPSVIQYNLFDRSFAEMPEGYLKAKLNAVLWFSTGAVWEEFTYLRKNIVLNDPTYPGGVNFSAFTGSKVICEGNWLQPTSGGSYLASGSGDWRWGENPNYDTGALIPAPSAATSWPSA